MGSKICARSAGGGLCLRKGEERVVGRGGRGGPEVRGVAGAPDGPATGGRKRVDDRDGGGGLVYDEAGVVATLRGVLAAHAGGGSAAPSRAPRHRNAAHPARHPPAARPRRGGSPGAGKPVHPVTASSASVAALIPGKASPLSR